MRHLSVPVALFTLLLANAASGAEVVDRSALSTLTNLVTISLSEHARFDVLSSSDVREVVALEAEKQAIGCESDTSCLAEVAGAMGARFVVFGQLGKLGSLFVLTLNLFDSEAAMAAGRVVTKGESLEQLAERIDGSVSRLVEQALRGAAAEGKLKVLVLDLKPASGELAKAPAATSEPVPVEAPPWFLVAGGATAGLGVVGLAAGVGFGFAGLGAAEEARAKTFQDETIAKRDEANGFGLAANASFIVGAGLIAVGAAVAALELVLAGDE